MGDAAEQRSGAAKAAGADDDLVGVALDRDAGNRTGGCSPMTSVSHTIPCRSAPDSSSIRGNLRLRSTVLAGLLGGAGKSGA